MLELFNKEINMNGKQAKKLKRLATVLTQQACEQKKVEYKDSAYTEMTTRRKKAKRIKAGIDKETVRDYEYFLMMGNPKDEIKEKEFYEEYDIALGTIKLSQICGRKVYQDMKKAFKKSAVNKKQISQFAKQI